MVEITNVNISDAPAILEIYKPYIEKTAITFECTVPTFSEFTERVGEISASHPYIVAKENGKVLGYAYLSPLKSREAYRRSAETSIYISENSRGAGLGKMLYAELERRAKDCGITNLYACIAFTDSPDETLDNKSVGFHEKMGYTLAGKFHACGEKFGRLYDIVWMEKII